MSMHRGGCHGIKVIRHPTKPDVYIVRTSGFVEDVLVETKQQK
jgi:hypothetical protein